MKRNLWTLLAMAALIAAIAGCNRGDEPRRIQGLSESEPVAASTLVANAHGAPTEVSAPSKRLPTDVVAEVDGVKMTRAQLDGDVKKRLASLSPQASPQQVNQMSGMLRKQIVDDFILQTLMQKEVTRLGIAATEGEIDAALTEMKAGLPAGANIDDLMNSSGVTREQLRKEIALGIKINKLVEGRNQGKAPPTEKEITDFYRQNQDKFKIPEAVHVRHILLARKEGEDEQARTARREKAERIRQELMQGKDFGELARANSDCPSKAQGGDLGTFTRGQMVKPFENAAFARKVNELGPIVETEFGFHILQVLERHPARTQPLDGETKRKIAGFLKEKRKYDAFNQLLGQLKEKAHIVVGEIS